MIAPNPFPVLIVLKIAALKPSRFSKLGGFGGAKTYGAINLFIGQVCIHVAVYMIIRPLFN